MRLTVTSMSSSLLSPPLASAAADAGANIGIDELTASSNETEATVDASERLTTPLLVHDSVGAACSALQQAAATAAPGQAGRTNLCGLLHTSMRC
jgi:hypothetical protein